jgi:anti-sigma regulatory factor (Ser/Thr protein kinase)
VNEDGAAQHRSTADGNGVEELTFGLADLPGVRDFAATQARRREMTEDRVGDFVVAVNEVATNAVTHGGGKARLRLWSADTHVFVEIHDDGHWTPHSAPGHTPPPDYATSGMGLWVARLLADTIRFETGPAGTTITMSFRL